MDRLPMAPSCALDEIGLQAQLKRYRAAGAGAALVARDRRELTVDLDRRVDTALVETMLAVERECCPFFDLRWEPDSRRLTIAVTHAEHEPALDAIAFALGLPVSA
jgi:hypothetical protein